MTKLSFIKLDIEIMNNTKIKMIRKMPNGAQIFELWIGILCLGMKSGRPGCLEIGDGIPFDDEMLSYELDIPLPTVKLGMHTFKKLNMVEIFEDQTIFISSFEHHQELTRIEQKKEKERLRKREYRKKVKGRLQLSHGTGAGRDVDGTKCPTIDIDKDTDKEKDLDIEIDIEKSKEEDLLSTYEEITSNNYNSKDLMKFIKYANSKAWITSYRFTLAQCADAGALLNACSVYSQSEILESIDNYDQLMEQGYDVPVYGNSITFLIKGIEKYLTSSKPFEKYRKKNQGDKPKKEKIDWTQYDD